MVSSLIGIILGREHLFHRLSGRAAIVHNPRVDSIGRSVRRPNQHHCRLLSGE